MHLQFSYFGAVVVFVVVVVVIRQPVLVTAFDKKTIMEKKTHFTRNCTRRKN